MKPTLRKKLIEVALPLDAINKASIRESYIYRGNPSALHKWWAQRPLAAARAVIFAQMVDDPSAWPELFPTEKAQHRERQRLFQMIEELVQWENTTNEAVIQKAREEIWQSWRRACAENADLPRAKELFDRDRLPTFHDPFAGGGSLPLEAQRLGLEAHASDLNPVAVLINKAMIEIPPRFAGRPPVNPEARQKLDHSKGWTGTQGLAEDVRYYGRWMQEEAERQIGHLYPKIEVTPEMVQDPDNPRPDLEPYVGRKLTVIAWLWARTVKSPNPAFAHVEVPLVTTFLLSTRKGKEAYVQPVLERGGYRFTVKVGKPKDPEAARKGVKSGGSGSSFSCLMSGTPIPFEYLRQEAEAKRMGKRLMAVVAEGEGARLYLPPVRTMESSERGIETNDLLETELPTNALGFRVHRYGMARWRDLFTPRQLMALGTLTELVKEAREQVRQHGLASGLSADRKSLAEGGIGVSAYAEAVSIYLTFAISKTSDYNCSLVPWYTKENRPGHLFSKQAIPMVWDFAELNPLCEIGGGFSASTRVVAGALSGCAASGPHATVTQADAVRAEPELNLVISTDPPYYDNIGYADLSEFFYVWLRRSLQSVFPDLFATLAVPKKEELVATPGRHGTKQEAEIFFLDGMTQAMLRLAQIAHPAFPATLYYAFKQAERNDDQGIFSTGWETFLDAVIRAGLSVTGTWPLRTERGERSRGIGSNALASSILLVCRKRNSAAPTATRREFVVALKRELPDALAHLQRENIAPVDLAQAAIGPGMAVFTRYSQVLDAEGRPVSVGQALALINQILAETMEEQEGDFDSETRWALAWFEQQGFAAGEFGVAEILSKAKNTSVDGMKDAGILDKRAPSGKVRLLRPEELPADWDPATDPRLTVWETVHHLIRVLESSGEAAAAELVARLGARAEVARELAYRLYILCDRPQKKRAPEALAYNGLVQSWPEIVRLAQEAGRPRHEQVAMFDEAEE